MYVALVIYNSKRTVLSSVAYPDIPYFFHFISQKHDFRGEKKVTEHKMCVLTVSTYRGADKSLARPRRKQANVSVTMA